MDAFYNIEIILIQQKMIKEENYFDTTKKNVKKRKLFRYIEITWKNKIICYN